MTRLLVSLLFACGVWSTIFAQEGRSLVAEHAAGNGPTRLESHHLPNLIAIHPDVLSGGTPDGPDAFDELRRRGVKTIISVDGAPPNVALATEFGLRYVHLPHGYDGVPPVRAAELAKAVRSLEKPLYIHCHHGKHRSPAAASVACVTAGLIPPTQSVAILELAGTSHRYRGLYRSARRARPIDAETVDAMAVTFRSQVEVPKLAEAMVTIETIHDRLLAAADDDWNALAEDSEQSVHDSLLLKEQFTEILRLPEVNDKPDAFQRMLRESESLASSIERSLRKRQRHATTPLPVEPIDRAVHAMTQNCKACHELFRDTPFRESE